MDNFVKTITDKRGRTIHIGGNNSDIVAEHNGRLIGRFEFDIQENEHSCIDIMTNCHIESNYQRCGIGTELIKLAEEWYDSFCIVNHLSNEGESFLNFCLHNNIFKLTHKVVFDDRY